MTIGKRKGYTAKGAGAQPNADNTKKVGGSLSKNDHWYIQEGFGMPFDPCLLYTSPSPRDATLSRMASSA